LRSIRRSFNKLSLKIKSCLQTSSLLLHLYQPWWSQCQFPRSSLAACFEKVAGSRCCCLLHSRQMHQRARPDLEAV
jgi:hypothetical protein